MTRSTPEPEAPYVQTADWVAAIRAAELTQPDPFVHDPYAPLLANEQARENAEMLRQLGAPADCAIIRGRLGDEALRYAVARGVRQVVSLGAGAETRAFRAEVPADLHYFEVDRPGIVTAKEPVLRAAGALPKCQRTVVEVDLQSEWGPRLTAAGLRTDRPALWILDGLLPYFSLPAQQLLLRRIDALSSPESVLVADVIDPSFLEQPGNQGFLTYVSEAGIQIFAADDSGEGLRALGWSVSAYSVPDLLAGHHPLLDDPIPSRLSNPRPGYSFLFGIRPTGT
jgi:methyltransferase (TIGR00027 family)